MTRIHRARGWRATHWFITLTLASIVTAANHTASESFRIGVFGDMPYIAGYKDPMPVLKAYRNLLDDINAHDAAFVVHVGDITNGPYCGDSVLNVRYQEFQSLEHPVVYLFGDNEWTDCRRGGFDPLERLARLRQIFTAGNLSLGKHPMPLTRQSEDARYSAYRENVRWMKGGVMFVGLHVPGSNNNWGPDSAHPSDEYVARNQANLAWLRTAFDIAERDSMRAVAIFMQADPAFDRTIIPPESRKYFTGFNDLLGTLRERTIPLFHDRQADPCGFGHGPFGMELHARRGIWRPEHPLAGDHR